MKSKAGKTIALVVLAVLAMCATAFKNYTDATGGFLNETTFVTSAAYTVTGNSGTFSDLGGYAAGMIVINVTAVSGTSPTLTVNFQTCSSTPGQQTAPAQANCATHTSSSSITATGVYFIKPVANFARWNTVTYTIGGTTPSFTFSVIGYFKPTS